MEKIEETQYFKQSQNLEVCKKIYHEAIDYINSKNFVIEVHQRKALLNHLAEMIKRNLNKELIKVEDKEVFKEISHDSIEKAKEIVDQFDHISKDEIYLLAIHFEVVKFN